MSDSSTDFERGSVLCPAGFTRREFAAFGAAAATFGGCASAGAATSPSVRDGSPRHGRCTSIDIHAHFMRPSSAPAGSASEGFKTPVFSDWNPQRAMAFMDAHGIDVQMLSHSAPLANAAEVRADNEFGASVVTRWPKRFGLLASLPMADVEDSLAEIAYSFDTLHADGIALVTNYVGHYLGNARFDPIWDVLNKRQAAVFIHPCSPTCFKCVGLGRPGPVLEFPLDTTRTTIDMLFANVFGRFPQIKFILAHAGGATATLADRVAVILEQPWCPNPHGLTEATALKMLSGLYFDTALASHGGALWPVMELGGPGQIVFGTDFPAAPPPVIAKNIASLKSFRGFKEKDLGQIGQTTASLFRRFSS